MILYRAMCHDEAEQTIKDGRPAFMNRFKWFGTEEFVRQRVQDGMFAKSRFKPDAYARVLRFEVSDDQLHHLKHVGKYEWMLDVRKVPVCSVRFVGEVHA